MSQLLEANQNQTLLVHTKLRRPRSVGQLVRRPRLLDLLHGGMLLPLTIVSAPPGYGKTTLISLWLGEIDIPWAWYSIGEEDDSLDIFAAYLAAALATAYPGFGMVLQSVLQSPTAPQPQRLADVFIGELDDLPGELVLVLDDYHAITNPEIHGFMSAVIQNAPAGVHFVLLVRSDPPLKLARLRAGQQVLEVPRGAAALYAGRNPRTHAAHHGRAGDRRNHYVVYGTHRGLGRRHSSGRHLDARQQ